MESFQKYKEQLAFHGASCLLGITKCNVVGRGVRNTLRNWTSFLGFACDLQRSWACCTISWHKRFPIFPVYEYFWFYRILSIRYLFVSIFLRLPSDYTLMIAHCIIIHAYRWNYFLKESIMGQIIFSQISISTKGILAWAPMRTQLSLTYKDESLPRVL